MTYARVLFGVMLGIAVLGGACSREALPTAPSAPVSTGGAGGGGTNGGGAGADSAIGGGTGGTQPTAASCSTGCYYVDAKAGNDSFPGTAAQPFRTPQRAVKAVSPGDTVIVRDGVYTGEGYTGPILYIYRGGAPDNLVVFKAEHRWGAILDGQANTSVTGIKLAASYLRVDGFEVRNTNHYGIDFEAGHTGLQAAGNNVHDVGRLCTKTGNGLSGFTVDDQDVVIEQNVVHDIGRYNVGDHGCTADVGVSTDVHDHGIYVSSGTNIVIRNNIFYNLTHGWAVHRYNSAGKGVDQLYVVNNTFAYANPTRDGYVVIDGRLTNSTIANNIFYSPRNAGILLKPVGELSGVEIANNLTFGGSITSGETAGARVANNLDRTDPRLVDVAGLNFHLQAGSPAIGAGLGLTYVSNDFGGAARGPGPATIGAYTF